VRGDHLAVHDLVMGLLDVLDVPVVAARPRPAGELVATLMVEAREALARAGKRVR